MMTKHQALTPVAEFKPLSLCIEKPIDLLEAAKTIVLLVIVKPLVITIREYKANRSAAQNRLYWAWLTDYENTDVNEHAGSTQEEWHDRFKRLCLSKIYERDDEQYAATMAALREVWRNGMTGESKTLLDMVIEKTSTTDANVEQFTEYLNYIEHYAHERGIQLRTDARLYAEAMGK